jgi:RNA 2',3'-cyclic 3'-phosphodiesterase
VKRLFVAVDVDAPVRDAIGRISTELQYRVPPRMRVSWVRPDRMHLTLHFFGEVNASQEQSILDALAPPVLHPAFDVSFEGLGLFPPRGSPRVLWLGVRHGVDELQRLQKAVLQRVHQVVPLRPGDNDAYRPHLTLARFRDRPSRPGVAEIISIRAYTGPFRIDRVTLYESRLSPAGPTYFRLADAPLTGKADTGRDDK